MRKAVQGHLVILAVLIVSLVCSVTATQERTVVSLPFVIETLSGQGYLFAHFKGNGESGLHFAYSTDGLVWEALNKGNPLLKPTVGRDKLMRDPHITLGPDGIYHMVWTTSWTEPVIGYASSPDMINWSEQRGIWPMTHEPKTRNVWAPGLSMMIKAGSTFCSGRQRYPGVSL